MTVETRPGLKGVRPEEVTFGAIIREVNQVFTSRSLGMTEKLAAETVVINALDNDLSANANPHVLYKLRGQIAEIIINAIANYEKMKIKVDSETPHVGRITTI